MPSVFRSASARPPSPSVDGQLQRRFERRDAGVGRSARPAGSPGPVPSSASSCPVRCRPVAGSSSRTRSHASSASDGRSMAWRESSAARLHISASAAGSSSCANSCAASSRRAALRLASQPEQDFAERPQRLCEPGGVTGPAAQLDRLAIGAEGALDATLLQIDVRDRRQVEGALESGAGACGISRPPGAGSRARGSRLPMARWTLARLCSA